jgi:hydroxymethylpyrimidine pyrophosphatase-like HAD family hydrolase
MLLKEEKEFYEKYGWALMPFLSFQQIIEKLSVLIDEDLNSKPDWCRREWNINLYMLSSAAIDLVDDYLVRGVINLAEVADHIPFLGKPIKGIEEASKFGSRIRGALWDREIRKWRAEWSEWLYHVCQPLVRGKISDTTDQEALKEELIPLLHYTFPRKLLEMRMRIPAAYRSQDLSHYDFTALGKEYAAKHHDHDGSRMIIGLRSAGSYIAPLVCCCLREEGFRQVSFMTIRPKSFIHPQDEAQLKKSSLSYDRFIVVDEPPSTGKSVARCVEIMKSLGIENRKITIMLPIHPAGEDWLSASLTYSLQECELITLPPGEWYKEKLLRTETFQDCIAPYFAELGLDKFEIAEDPYIEKVNKELAMNPDKGFHRRLKRVFKVNCSHDSGSHDSVFVMAKSVGWGWLGYHAPLATQHLSEFIPRVYGVRNGMLFMEWVGSSDQKRNEQNFQDNKVQRLSAYIIRRTNQLRLIENPMPFLNDYTDSGFQPIAAILSRAFSSKVKILKRGWLTKQLEEIGCPVPTFLDSRMSKEEWVDSQGKLLKTDFEHHGFSKTASHNIVDPAYDMAAAMLEFELSEKEKEDLENAYMEGTEDVSVEKRLFFYKLLCGSEAMSESLRMLNKVEYSSIYRDLNRNYINAWNFLVSESARASAKLCVGEPVRRWFEPIFVMDVDDVLDKNIFGFPSTTANGIMSLSLLRTHGICSAINTARSLEEVKDYCRQYGFVGGIAEYGSLLWDDIDQKAEVMVPEEAMDELEKIRSALGKIPGIFVNPYYQYSIRAYIFDWQRTHPLPDATIGELFRLLGTKFLKAKKSYIDTAIIASSVDKGKSMLRLKELKGLNHNKMGAIGDTESDLPMLLVADQGFLVANGGANLKQLARKYGVTVTNSSYQTGLLEAVQTFLHGSSVAECEQCKQVTRGLESNKDLFSNLLKISDLSTVQHWLRAIDRNVFAVIKRLSQ